MKDDVFGLSERVINRGVSFSSAFRRCVTHRIFRDGFPC
jgi:hypothetical protein